jgi:hypothetical protein
MRAFIKENFEGEYASVNFAVASDGFRTMGWEIVHYQDLASTLPTLKKEDILVDFMDESKQALTHLGFKLPELPTYPESLHSFLGRKIWMSTINAVASSPEKWPVFVKPRDAGKNFTGVLVRGTRDLVGCGDPARDTPIWCSEPAIFRSEWRCFVRYGKILDVRPYKGDWRGRFDPKVIEDALTAWTGKPRGCALDFGVDDRGRTLLIETNEGIALGAYGLVPRDYARVLSARWTEVVGTKDECDF